MTRPLAVFELVEPRVLLAATISGAAWDDANSNGIKDAGEAALAGWTIYLDADHDNKFDAGEPSTVSAANGTYSFTNLSAGTYLVGAVIKPGWKQTSPSAPAAAPTPAAAPALT